MFLQVYNNTNHACRLGHRDHDQRHPGQHLHARSVPERDQPVRLPRRRRCPPKASCRRPSTTADYGPTQGALLLFKIQVVSLDNRPLELKIVDPDEPVADGLGRARRLAQAGQPDRRPAGRLRAPGGRPAPRWSPPAPSLTSSTQTTIRGCSAGANAANQASVLLGFVFGRAGSLPRADSLVPVRAELVSGGGLQALFSSAVPVLPATVTPGIAAEVPVPSRTTPIIRRRTVRATVARSRPATPPAASRRGRKVGGGRRPPSAIVAATVRHLQGAGQDLALADRGRADVQFALDLQAGGQRALGGAGDRPVRG